eukprot:14842350-Ditylum_brightwellii.AAC.1
MSEWCDKESPDMQGPNKSCAYDLYGVVNHYGNITGGHYVVTCKATVCSPDGSEELAYNFNGTCNGESYSEVGGWEEIKIKDQQAHKQSSLQQLLPKLWPNHQNHSGCSLMMTRWGLFLPRILYQKWTMLCFIDVDEYPLPILL